VNSLPDALVIGAGIIGASIAWRLSQRGTRVMLLDAGRFGDQASRAGAGMLAPGGEVDRESPWARRSVESLRMYPAFLDELTAESEVAIDYRVCGAIEVAFSAQEVEEAARRARAQAELGIRSSAIAIEEARRLAPALAKDAVVGARYYPDDAIVDPRDVLRALRQACANRGVVICENRAVSSIDAAQGRAMAAGSPIAAGAIVLAAGAWSGNLLAGAVKSFPVKGHLIGYDLRPGSLEPILRRGHTYVLQRGSGLTIAGSTMERVGFDASVDPKIAARLHRRARRLLPALLLSSPDSSWIGFRPAVAGDEPQVGRFRDSRVWLAYGHYRNGILLAPVTARIIADEIAP
jgi:glycine oxidase